MEADPRLGRPREATGRRSHETRTAGRCPSGGVVMDTFAIREPALLPTAVVGEASPGVGMPGQLDTVENIDLLLVKRARRGDQRAFETLLDRHDARLRALV